MHNWLYRYFRHEDIWALVATIYSEKGPSQVPSKHI